MLFMNPISDSFLNPATHPPDKSKTIILAGATGHLGQRIASYLLRSGAKVKALTRKDFAGASQLSDACAGGTCVVSAISGLEDVIVEAQTVLLQAAISAGVPRFIPSDYCIDYTKLSYGNNRNLDLRKRFNESLDKAPIAATSILNGMFTDLLTGQAPVVLFGLKRVLYWGNAEQLLDFTTMENTAEYTAMAALDESTPRYLRIAGDVINARGLQIAAKEATGNRFHLLRPGGLGMLQTLTRITRALMPAKKEVFPPWQGMQYMHDMFSGKPKLDPLDNQRYPDMEWTSVRQVLAQRKK